MFHFACVQNIFVAYDDMFPSGYHVFEFLHMFQIWERLSLGLDMFMQ